MRKILCVCDEGNNRSVQIAHLLRYRGHEALAVGARTSSEETRVLLAGWADLVIFTDPAQVSFFAGVGAHTIWPLPDAFPRPFNPQLLQIVRGLIEREGL